MELAEACPSSKKPSLHVFIVRACCSRCGADVCVFCVMTVSKFGLLHCREVRTPGCGGAYRYAFRFAQLQSSSVAPYGVVVRTLWCQKKSHVVAPVVCYVFGSVKSVIGREAEAGGQGS